MKEGLFYGLGSFAGCWLVHWAIWRIRRPEAYPVWLPVIFWVLPAAATLIVLAWQSRLQILTQPGGEGFPLAAAALLQGAVSLCYMCGYAGVIEYSPSAEILMEVRALMPAGVAPDELRLDSLTEYALTGKRIEHLFCARMIEQEGEELRLTSGGCAVVLVCKLYRLVFGVAGQGRG